MRGADGPDEEKSATAEEAWLSEESFVREDSRGGSPHLARTPHRGHKIPFPPLHNPVPGLQQLMIALSSIVS